MREEGESVREREREKAQDSGETNKVHFSLENVACQDNLKLLRGRTIWKVLEIRLQNIDILLQNISIYYISIEVSVTKSFSALLKVFSNISGKVEEL